MYVVVGVLEELRFSIQMGRGVVVVVLGHLRWCSVAHF